MKKSKKKGIKFEDKVQKSIASGKLWFSPLDLRYEDYCIECKTTDKNSYRITLNLLEKIWDQALSMEKEAFLIIGIPRNDKEIFMLQCKIIIERKQM